jgi:hypothetical protein
MPFDCVHVFVYSFSFGFGGKAMNDLEVEEAFEIIEEARKKNLVTYIDYLVLRNSVVRIKSDEEYLKKKLEALKRKLNTEK